MPTLTHAINKLSFQELTTEIKRTMRRSAKDAVQLGYMLKLVVEKKLWEGYYSCLDDYLRQELRIDYSLATRFIKINQVYGDPVIGMEIKPEYENYTQGALIEMLNMPEEQREQVTPDMTVKQIRQIKQAEKEIATSQKKKAEEYCAAYKFQQNCAGCFYENREDCPYDRSGCDEAETKDIVWFVGQYAKNQSHEADSVMNIINAGKSHAETAKQVQEHLSPYGCHTYHCGDYGLDFMSYAKGIDMKFGDTSMHMSYIAFVKAMEDYMERTGRKTKVAEDSDYREIAEPAAGAATVPAAEEMLSPYGLAQSVYPDDSLIKTEGCGNKYYCFCCAADCSIRQADRYCVEAPMGHSFPCVSMNVIDMIRTDIGDCCQFINQELAYHTEGSGEASPCCKKCNNADCGYRCSRAALDQVTQSVYPEAVQPEQQDAGDRIKTDNLSRLRMLLDRKKKELHECLLVSETDPLPEDYIFERKSIVGALASMLYELENEEQDPDQEPVQPEMPVLKNNDSRKKWLEDYKDWGLWYRDDRIDVNYYKYDFSDGSRLVVAEYPQREQYWNTDARDEHYYHLLQKNKEKYGGKKKYDEKYRHSTDSETYLIDFIKNLQKQ